ncbi:MAG: peptide ABC transporter substrate-binding protein [Bifidobacterium sp.]|uniref:Peptide ABC transporter substrate-binding protein n=1 Tax=Bifidobacterium fermentum TaxID=3059035 RepID=A0AB39UD80_9BIFI
MKGNKKIAIATAVVSALAMLLSGCGGSNGSSQEASSKDEINYALPADFTPNWILPIGKAGKLNTNNISIAASLWEPLVAYDGSTGKVAWHKDASIANDVKFASDGKSAEITLADRTWSDNEPITSRDVEFWYNLVKANKADWANYNEGFAPDNWTSLKIIDDTHFTLTFDRTYNSEWMLANQLSMITPLPQHAWDKTSDSGKVGDYDTTTAGAKQVWTYLNDQADSVSSYATNKLWKVVSGPYTIKTFSTSGNVTLVANAKYDGGEKAQIKTVNLLPFTSVSAEENAVRSGQVDYGYISPTSVANKSQFTQLGYKVVPWNGWAITYFPYNFNNPTMGAVFKQLYARQAIQKSVDQKSLISTVFSGMATAGYGPIPQSSSSSFVSSKQKSNPYPFSNSKAKALLTAHGWKAGSDGILVCENAGTGSDQCGEGVKSGTRFSMQVLAQSGSEVTDNELLALQSSFKKSGIEFKIKKAPVNTVLAQTPQCTASEAICSWQLSYFGTMGSWYFPAYPTGDSLFKTGGGSNFGNYSDATMDAAIDATTQSKDNSAIQSYSELGAEELPVVWLPEPDYQISVIKSGITAPQDTLANFHPARWSWSK